MTVEPLRGAWILKYDLVDLTQCFIRCHDENSVMCMGLVLLFRGAGVRACEAADYPCEASACKGSKLGGGGGGESPPSPSWFRRPCCSSSYSITAKIVKKTCNPITSDSVFTSTELSM